MVHGSSYPAEATFDLKLNGVSMMDALAAGGVDVWLMDVTGYGTSSISRTFEALEQVDVVVRHILGRLQRRSLRCSAGHRARR